MAIPSPEGSSPQPHYLRNEERSRRLKTISKYYADIRANNPKPVIANTVESMDALKTIHHDMGPLRAEANKAIGD